MQEYDLNNPALKDRRRELRKNQTPAEKIIWEHVRGRRLGGYRFLRQYSVGFYILDFYCPAKKLGIELDGGQHRAKDGSMYDQERTAYLEGFGIKTIRFPNEEIMQNLPSVLNRILTSLSYQQVHLTGTEELV